MNNPPTLSVTLTFYNQAQYVGGALEAILNQSYTPHEVVVVDDASTDNSYEIIQRFARMTPFLKAFRNQENLGAMLARRRAHELITGDYLYNASADDRVLPGFFEKSMRLLAKYPQAGLCCSFPTCFYSHNGAISENPVYWSRSPRYFSPDQFADVVKGWYIAGHTSIVKRSAMIEAGG